MKFKKSGSTRRRVKHNPKRRKAARRRVKRNPAPSHIARRRHVGRRRHARRNPAGLDLKSFGLEVAAAGAGALAAVYINNLAAKWIPARFRGVASIAAGAAVIMFAGKTEAARGAAIGAAGMGLLDIVRANVPALVPLSAEDAGYILGNASIHDESIAAMLGADNSDVPGVLPNIFGVDTGSVPMGADGVFGADNYGVPGVLPNIFGVDTGSVPMGEGEGDFVFAEDDED